MKTCLAIDKTLVVRDSAGSSVWEDPPEGRKVAWATSIPDSEDGLVFYEPYPSGWQRMSGFQNLVRVSPKGKVIWHAELPERGTKYVNAVLVIRGLRAFAPSYDVDLDLQTGKIVKQFWTK